MTVRRVVIVGGVAGGMSAATRLRRLDEDVEVVVLERSGNVSFANCGLPYYVVGVIEDEDDLEIAATRARRSSTAEPKRGGPRFIQFLRASWAELQRVQWPDRRQVAQATAVVIGFVAIAGAYLGAADWVANQIVKAIL